MMLGKVPRALVVVGASLCVLLLVMSLRAVLEARAEAEKASAALEVGDVELAIVRLRASARWDAPFNVYAERSLLRLERLAEQAEQAGEYERALSAYRSVHAAIQATRSFYTSHTDVLARADQRIAALMAREPAANIEGSRSVSERRADYLALLQAHDPEPLGVLLAFAGFVTWVGSAVVFVSWGVDQEGRILRGVARRSVLFLLLGWIAFAVGLRIA
jgi:tetratricopeptide (TPR) repeat protein